MLINIPRRQIIGGLLVAVLFAAMIALGLSHPSPADDSSASKASDFSPYVTKDGGISRPTDYRDTFEYLGSYAVATKPDKPLDEMHVVYARPEDVRAYRRDGKFPDGATLVKEVTPGRLGEAHHGAVPLGHGHQALVRDDQGREGPVPRQRPVGRRVGLGPLPGERARTQRGHRLFDRLQDVPHPGQEGRLGVRPRIPCPREGRPGQMNRESNTTEKELLIPWCQRRGQIALWVTW